MRNPHRAALHGLTGVVLAVGLTACSDAGDLSIVNNGPDAVTVATGDEDVTVDADGGTVLLDYGCTPGDVTVTFPTGATTVLPGPICPDQEIVVGDGTASLHPAESRPA